MPKLTDVDAVLRVNAKRDRPAVQSAAHAAWPGRGPGWRDARLRRMLGAADLLAVALASLTLSIGVDQVHWLVLPVLGAPLWLALAKVQGLYDQDQRSLRHLTIDEVSKLVMWSVLVTIGISVISHLAGARPFSLVDALSFACVVGAAVFVLRVAARWGWRHVTPPERTAIIGGRESAAIVRRKLELFDDIHVTVVAEIDRVEPADIGASTEWLASLDRVLVASSQMEEELISDLLRVCRAMHVKLSLVPPVPGMFGTAVQLNHIADLPVVEYNTWDVARSTLFLKHVLDLAICIIVLPVAAPLCAVLALAVKLDSPGPAMFTQIRVGLGGRPFRMFKLRTMVKDATERLPDLITLDELSEPVFKLDGDPRITRVGHVLRRWSLDELPQLLNVLLGQMSMVGPRPEQIEVVEMYGPDHLFRLQVKPGLTGPMQVFGRGSLSFAERLAVERDYVENLTLRRDLRLLALTFAAVIRGRGAR